MTSVLVVYGSWAGSTAGVAHRVGKALTNCGSTVRVVPASSAPDPAGYDAVIVGSGVRGGEWHPVVTAWTAAHAAALTARPTAFFTVCLTPVVHPANGADARGYCLPVTMETGVHPRDIGVFAGSFEPNQHALKSRMLARLWGAKRGDFRDWSAIDEWATGVSRRLEPTRAPYQPFS